MDPQNPWVPFHAFQKSVGSAEPTLTTPLPFMRPSYAMPRSSNAMRPEEEDSFEKAPILKIFKLPTTQGPLISCSITSRVEPLGQDPRGQDLILSLAAFWTRVLLVLLAAGLPEFSCH